MIGVVVLDRGDHRAAQPEAHDDHAPARTPARRHRRASAPPSTLAGARAVVHDVARRRPTSAAPSSTASTTAERDRLAAARRPQRHDARANLARDAAQRFEGGGWNVTSYDENYQNDIISTVRVLRPERRRRARRPPRRCRSSTRRSSGWCRSSPSCPPARSWSCSPPTTRRAERARRCAMMDCTTE